MSGTWIFLPVTDFSYYNTLNLSVTGRKIHVPDMKIDVNSQFFLNSIVDLVALRTLITTSFVFCLQSILIGKK